MTIQSTIQTLYAIMCEAQEIVTENGSKARMAHLLSKITDKDVDDTLQNISWMLNELSAIDEKFKGMYILHYTTANDKDKVLLQTECIFGTQTIKFITQFDEKAAQSLIDALTWSLNMAKAGDRLTESGRA